MRTAIELPGRLTNKRSNKDAEYSRSAAVDQKGKRI